MYDIVKQVIDGGGYDLADLTHRINVLFARGELTEEESAELLGMAQDKAKPEDQLPALTERVGALEVRVAALEEATGKPAEGTEEEGTDTEWPPYVQPTSKDTYYNKGDQITFTDGKHYRCVKNNVANGPDVNAKAWELVEE